MTGVFVLADTGDAIAGLVATAVQLVSLVILIYVLIDLARNFAGDLPEPVLALHEGLGRLCEPLFAPVRRVLPPMGGIDFSPLVTLIALSVIGNFIVTLLR